MPNANIPLKVTRYLARQPDNDYIIESHTSKEYASNVGAATKTL